MEREDSDHRELFFVWRGVCRSKRCLTKTGTGVTERVKPDISVAGPNRVMLDVMRQLPSP